MKRDQTAGNVPNTVFRHSRITFESEQHNPLDKVNHEMVTSFELTVSKHQFGNQRSNDIYCFISREWQFFLQIDHPRQSHSL